MLNTRAWVIFWLFLLALEETDGKCTVQDVNECIIVTCRDLQSLAPLASLPENVTHLDLSHNALTGLNASLISRFKELKFFDISFNNFSSLSPSYFENFLHLEVLNISHNELTSLNVFKEGPSAGIQLSLDVFKEGPSAGIQLSHEIDISDTSKTNNTTRQFSFPGLFWNLTNLRHLMLSNNNLQSISFSSFHGLHALRVLNLSYNALSVILNDSFQQLIELEDLDLSANQLESLEPRSFNGLKNLTTLRLSFNKLQYDYNALPPTVFEPVGGSLTSIHLEGNIRDQLDGDYPDDTFRMLRSLQLLKVDSFPELHFGEGFAELRELAILDLTYKCHVHSLFNETFINFQNSRLEALYLISCSLSTVEICALCPLTYLKILSLAASALPLSQALRSFYGLQTHNVSHVDFSTMERPSRFGSTVLDRYTTEFLLNTCISTLILRSNDIAVIKNGALVSAGSRFNRCIQNIDLSYNAIWQISVTEIMAFFKESINLVTFKNNEQKIYTIEKALFLSRNYKPEKPKKFALQKLFFSLPSKLAVLNISGSFDFESPMPDLIQVQNADSLRVFDMSYINIIGCEYQIAGLELVESLNMSGNDCHWLSPKFFDSFPSVRVLSLQAMNFDPAVIRAYGHRLFQKLTHLSWLDLSENEMDYLPFDLLLFQPNLREFLLTRNRFQRVPEQLDNLEHLELLDMRHNVLSRLQEGEWKVFDTLAVKSEGRFRLNLGGNPLVCTCDTLYFVRWLHATNVILDEGGDYPCTTENGDLTSTRRVALEWDFAWRRCIGPSMLWGSLAGFLVLLILLGGAWGFAMNATRLRFLLTVFRRVTLPQRHQFLKDAYLAYSARDWEIACIQVKHALQDQRGVRLLIKDLPIDAAATQFYQLPGDNECEKILEHIDMCWKVILVVTDTLSRDPMAGFMVRAVLQSISDRMPERVVVLFVDADRNGIPEVASLRTLLESVPEKNVFFVTRDTPDNHQVWDSMMRIILEQP